MTTTRGTAGHGLAELFDAELTPLVRRMAYRPPHKPPDPGQDADNQTVRDMVWQGLVSLGIPDLARSGDRRQETLVGIAEHLGWVLYQGPLLDTLTATELLVRTGTADLLPAGVSVAVAARDTGGPATPGPLTVDPDVGTVSARREFVGFAADVDHLLVVGRTATGVRVALVPRDHPTVALRRREDLGRGEAYRAVLAGTPVLGWVGEGPDWDAVLANARIRQAGYLVGLARGVLDLAVAYAKQRHQFDQPIGQFQWIAFRLSALAARIDAVRLLTQDAARLVDTADSGGSGGDKPGDTRHHAARHAEIRFAAAQCLATTADVARATATEAMQVHGAIGMTSDNDAQLYYRRVGVETLWWGSPTELRAESLPLLRSRVVAQPPSTRDNPVTLA